MVSERKIDAAGFWPCHRIHAPAHKNDIMFEVDEVLRLHGGAE
jgi:hypothetical protein